KRWSKFSAFLRDMGDHPGRGYSLHRIDNDGDYKLSNCRWATRQEQARNAFRPLGRSGLRGVRRTEHNRFRCEAWHNGMTYHLGNYSTAEAAAQAYKDFAAAMWSHDVANTSAPGH